MDSEQTAQEPFLFPHRDQETSPAMVPVSKNPDLIQKPGSNMHKTNSFP